MHEVKLHLEDKFSTDKALWTECCCGTIIQMVNEWRVTRWIHTKTS